MLSSSLLRSSLFLVAFIPLTIASCELHAPGGDCDCPFDLTACEIGTCEAGACVISIDSGELDSEYQVPGDCKSLTCDDARDPVQVEDLDDVGDDGNACTQDLCSSGGPVQDPLPFGSPCEGDGVCAAEVVCVSCAGEPCWDVDCTADPKVIDALDPGTSCGDNQFCDGAGVCFVCDDMSSCTIEECTSGVLVVTEQLPFGAACEDGGYCGNAGECIPCDDGNECTADDCTGGVETFTNEPLGTPCGSSDSCENGVCITWCTPLPDLETCPDTGEWEATDDDPSGEPQFLDDDEARKPICGVLTAGDEDWISYYAEDESFENDINDFQFWSFSKNLRFCAFAECAGPTSAPCEDGGTPTTGPNGAPGCCWQGTFNTLDIFSMNLDCVGSDTDSGWVRIRIDNPSDDECAPYGVLGFGY